MRLNVDKIKTLNFINILLLFVKSQNVIKF